MLRRCRSLATPVAPASRGERPAGAGREWPCMGRRPGAAHRRSASTTREVGGPPPTAPARCARIDIGPSWIGSAAAGIAADRDKPPGHGEMAVIWSLRASTTYVYPVALFEATK